MHYSPTSTAKCLGLALVAACALAGCATGESSEVAFGMPGWLLYCLSMLLLFVVFVLVSYFDVRRRAREDASGNKSSPEAFLDAPEYDGDVPPHLHSALVMLRLMALRGYDERGWRGVLVAWAQSGLVFSGMTLFGWGLTAFMGRLFG